MREKCLKPHRFTLELKNIARVHLFLSHVNTEMLMHTFISNGINKCNGLLSSLQEKVFSCDNFRIQLHLCRWGPEREHTLSLCQNPWIDSLGLPGLIFRVSLLTIQTFAVLERLRFRSASYFSLFTGKLKTYKLTFRVIEMNHLMHKFWPLKSGFFLKVILLVFRHEKEQLNILFTEL